MADNFYGSICLSDIPRECIISHANGKKYLNVDIRMRQTQSQFGHTHYIKVSPPKGVILPQGTNMFIGDLKPSQYQPDQTAQPTQNLVNAVTQAAPYLTPVAGDNLPF